ncbi:MAG TPA: translation elongation factor Ts [Candidatus Peribacteraceae bacterium]|nr:translation elongation factor Ts [Candidatus Peribacteraceae bacterium]
MSNVSAAAVQSLRARTGVSISAVRDALEEAGGDEEKAIELLRKRGIAQAAKKAAREQSEGLVFLKEEGSKAAMFILRCETDFVARDTNFHAVGKEILDALFAQGMDAAKSTAEKKVPDLVQQLGENITIDDMHVIEAPVVGTYLHSNSKIGVIIGLDAGSKDVAKDISMHSAALNPLYVHPEEVGMDVLEKEKEIWREQLKKEGKPEAMWDKIMMGKEKKFREENSIVKQAFVKDPSKTVEQHLGDAKITTYVRVSVA